MFVHVVSHLIEIWRFWCKANTDKACKISFALSWNLNQSKRKKSLKSPLPLITVSITLVLLQMGSIPEHLGAKITCKSSYCRGRPLLASDHFFTRPQLGRVRRRCRRRRGQAIGRRLIWRGGKRIPGVTRVSQSPKILQQLGRVGCAVWKWSRSDS